MRILVVERDSEVVAVLESALRGGVTRFTVVGDPAAALDVLGDEPCDVVLVCWTAYREDVSLSERLGKADPSARLLLVVSQHDFATEVVDCPWVDVDGFLSLPCEAAELRARVRASVRDASSPVLRRTGLVLSPHHPGVFRHGRPIALSARERCVLDVLVGAGGAVVGAGELAARCRGGSGCLTTGIVRNAVMNLRRKLGDPPVIVNVPRIGYRITWGSAPGGGTGEDVAEPLPAPEDPRPRGRLGHAEHRGDL